ncbi:MAG: hypothetical protein JRI96_07435 [Deltaproteobacteria bacterium]|nr:hypothetical protein [Deltaproteobacteria bacterium]
MKKLFFIILLSLSFSSFVYCDSTFDRISSAIKNDATDLQLRKFEDEYEGKSISGRSYVTRVTESIWGDTVVKLSTEKDPYSSSSVGIMIFLKESYIDRALKLKKGDSVSFSGTFKGIGFIKTIIVHDGEIKYSHSTKHEPLPSRRESKSNGERFKESYNACKIQGVEFSAENPSVAVGGSIFHLNDFVCGGEITYISHDKVTIKFKEGEKDYTVGDIIK